MKQSNNILTLDNKNDPQVIQTDSTAHDTSTVDDIAATWSAGTGLLLKPDINTVNPSGKYTGTLTWTISDATPN